MKPVSLDWYSSKRRPFAVCLAGAFYLVIFLQVAHAQSLSTRIRQATERVKTGNDEATQPAKVRIKDLISVAPEIVRTTPARAAADSLKTSSNRAWLSNFAAHFQQARSMMVTGPISPEEKEVEVKEQEEKGKAFAAEATYYGDDETYATNAKNLVYRAEKGERVLGGGPAPVTAYRYCVGIADEDGNYNSTGSLIHERLVLTARHIARRKAPGMICIGDDLNQLNNPTYEVERSIPERVTVDEPDGLMLLFLKEPVKDVKTVALPHGNFDGNFPFVRPQGGATDMEVVGFGATDPFGKKGFGQKRFAFVPFAGNQPADYNFHPGTEFSAGLQGLNIDTCSGDSGGPGLYYDYNEKRNFQVAVTSRSAKANAHTPPGVVCGEGGIYIRVDNQVDWIRSTAKQEFGLTIP